MIFVPLFRIASDRHSIAIINGTNYSKIKDIPIGKHPTHMALQDTPPPRNILYVVNSGSGTISVINGTNYSKITEIPVGMHTSSTSIDSGNNIIYVANSDPGSVTAIYGKLKWVLYP